MGQPSFSIVVPIIPKHHRYALRLVKNLLSGPVKPLEIIFAGSSQTNATAQELNPVSQLYPNLVRLELTSETCTAGQNRNRGWNIAHGKYVSFCDADDLYSPYRLQILQAEAERTSPDLMLHSFYYMRPQKFLRLNPFTYTVIETKEIFDSTFPDGERNRNGELGIAGESNIILPHQLERRNSIQHGHATVKASLPIRYTSYPYAEDGIFCRDVLYASNEVTYISAKLSIYETLNLGNVTRNSALRFIAVASRLKKVWIQSL